jgi:acyl carrier protein
MVVPESFETVKAERLRASMSPAEGIEVIRRVLGCWHESQILISTVRLAPRLNRERSTTAEESPQKSSFETSDELAAILDVWKDLLGNEDIQPDDNFFELGGHSLMGTMVGARIRDRFGVTLTLRTLFEAATPQALAEVVRASIESNSKPLEPTVVTAGDREEFEI